MEKKLNFSDCYSIGLGTTVGAGVVTMTGLAIGMTGSGVGLAFLLAGVLNFIAMFPFLIVGSTIPRTSGSYTFSKELIDSKAGGIYLCMFLFGRVAMAFLGASVVTYIGSIVPALNNLWPGVLVVTLFYVSNLFGVQTAAKLQKVMNVVLLIALLSFVVMGAGKMDPAVFTAKMQFTNGFTGMFNAISLVVFAIGGGFSLLELGQQVNDPQRTLPKAILAVSITAAVIFGAVGLVGSGVLPLEEVAGKPLTIAAKAVYPSAALYAFFILGGVLLAIFTTINGSYVWYSNALIKGCDEGWLPGYFAKRNRYGVPYRLMTLFWLIGIVPLFLGADVSLLSRVSTGLLLLANIIPNFALLKLPEKYPEEWKNSVFYMKSSFMVKAVTFGCSAIMALFIYFNFKTFPPTILLAILGLIGLGVIYVCVIDNKIKKGAVK